MSNYINKEEIHKIFSCTKASDEIVGIYEKILDLPSADVRENIHGEWEFVQKGRFVDICCNKCNHVMCKDYAYGYQLDELDIQQVKHMAEKRNIFFCACCGADMRPEPYKAESEVQDENSN